MRFWRITYTFISRGYQEYQNVYHDRTALDVYNSLVPRVHSGEIRDLQLTEMSKTDLGESIIQIMKIFYGPKSNFFN